MQTSTSQPIMKPLLADIVQVGLPAAADTGITLSVQLEHWSGTAVHLAALIFTILIGMQKLKQKKESKANE